MQERCLLEKIPTSLFANVLCHKPTLKNLMRAITLGQRQLSYDFQFLS